MGQWMEGYLDRSREKMDVFAAARSWSAQMVDEIIEPRETRLKIIEALILTRGKRLKLPEKARQYGTGPT
jgi:acetyl-CoA carboxylase carboxyltransferase component